MPLDPSIPLSVQPIRFNDPFQVLQQYRDQAQERQYRDQLMRNAQANEEERRRKTEQERQQAEQKAYSDKVLADAYRQSIDPKTKKVNPDTLTSILVEQGIPGVPDIVKGVYEADSAAEKARNDRNVADKSDLEYAATLARPMIASKWNPAVIEAGLAHAEEQGHDVRQFRQMQQQPEQFKKFVTNLANPESTKPVNVPSGGALVNPNTGQPIYENRPEIKPPTPGSKEDVLARFARERGKNVADLTTKEIGEADRIVNPPAPPARSYQRTEITDAAGNSRLANFDSTTGKYYDQDTGQELKGAKPAPTADMKNKAQGRELVAKSIGAVKGLSDKVLTKIGPAQRAEAIKRGAEAVFGNDPEFRTYQDARMALAGNLAVGQQGSRPSDADIKAIWLPLVPDPYRDTSESAKMKWDLINTMSSNDKSPAAQTVALPPASAFAGKPAGDYRANGILVHWDGTTVSKK